MTKPLRRRGNPLGDSNISKEERIAWYALWRAADDLTRASQALQAYADGHGTTPCAYDVLSLAQTAWDAQNEAIALRRGREIERRKKRKCKRLQKS